MPLNLHEVMGLVNLNLSGANLARLRLVSQGTREMINKRPNLTQRIKNDKNAITAEAQRLKNQFPNVRFYKNQGWTYNKNKKTVKPKKFINAWILMKKYPSIVNEVSPPPKKGRRSVARGL